MSPEVEATTAPCLFCMRAGRKPSIEHVIPAGLGRHADIELPRGAVCEPCNNQLGRQVDEALVHLIEVQFIRGLYGVADHKGRTITELSIGNGTLHFSRDGGLHVIVHDDQDITTKDADTVVVSVFGTRRKSGDQWRRATRAILKMGLGLAYHSKGPGFALSRDWNRTREAIRGTPYAGYLLIGQFDIHKPPDLQAQLLFDVPGATAVARLQFGGLELLADLALGPASHQTREWAATHSFEVMDIAPNHRHTA